MTPQRPESRPFAGAAFLIAGFTVIPLADVSAKHLVELGYAALLVAWGRFFLSTVVLSPLLLRKGAIRDLTGPGFWIKTLRAALLATASVLFFSAFKTMPLADAFAVYFIYPFLITLMAPVLLGEKVGLHRIGAVLVGFAGSLLIIRPGMQAVPVGVFYALGTSVCFALFNILTRRLSGQGDPWLQVFFQSAVGTVVLGVFVTRYWQMPDAGALGHMALLIAAAIVGHWLLMRAYDHAPASFLAPFGYFEMVSAVVLGYLWFDDLPDAWTWAGIAVIVGSGVYISVRERKRKALAPTPPAAPL